MSLLLGWMGLAILGPALLLSGSDPLTSGVAQVAALTRDSIGRDIRTSAHASAFAAKKLPHMTDLLVNAPFLQFETLERRL